MQCTEPDDYITSVKWASDGNHVAVGLANSDVQLWDVNRVKQVRSLKGHAARVSALAWNRSTLSTGGRDSIILNHDVRSAPPSKFSTICTAWRSIPVDLWQLHVISDNLLIKNLEILYLLIRKEPERVQSSSGLIHICNTKFSGLCPCLQEKGAHHSHIAGAPTGGVRVGVVPQRRAACQWRERQSAAHLVGRQPPPAAPVDGASGGRQGAGLVPLPVEPAGFRRRHRRPLHPLLEHDHRHAAQLHRHAVTGTTFGRKI